MAPDLTLVDERILRNELTKREAIDHLYAIEADQFLSSFSIIEEKENWVIKMSNLWEE
ncbi:MAG: hypothetical protein KA264_08005 [Crocinitomicaceae bacterium]|nr:hypothetical protein [Crocinitomicaceae bacterium]